MQDWMDHVPGGGALGGAGMDHVPGECRGARAPYALSVGRLYTRHHLHKLEK